MKKLLTNAAKGLAAVVATTIVTRIIGGEPLSGLLRLRGVYRTFIQVAVPAWAFAIVFLLALSGIYYASTHLRKGWPKGTVHFVPDAHNSGWGRQSDALMDVRIGGTFTYEGKRALTVVRAYLKGTQPVSDMNATILGWGSGPVTLAQLCLEAHVPTTAVIQVYLRPLIGIPCKSLWSNLVLRDTYNRDFVIGPLELPCLGSGQGVRMPLT